ncbi:MAG: hypothetical protein WDN26_21525 [Chitinophagaceae bacterium]
MPFKTVNRSLENTNSTVDMSTNTILTSLQQKTTQAETAERANIWYPKANSARQYSLTVYNYIQGLKERILREADGDPNNPEKKFKEENLDIATRVMVEKGEGKKLQAMLAQYKTNMLGIDSLIIQVLLTHFQ